MPRQNHKQRASMCVYTGAIKDTPPPRYISYYLAHRVITGRSNSTLKSPKKWLVTDVNFIIGAPLEHADGVKHAGTTYLRGNEYTTNTH